MVNLAIWSPDLVLCWPINVIENEIANAIYKRTRALLWNTLFSRKSGVIENGIANAIYNHKRALLWNTLFSNKSPRLRCCIVKRGKKGQLIFTYVIVTYVFHIYLSIITPDLVPILCTFTICKTYHIHFWRFNIHVLMPSYER